MKNRKHTEGSRQIHSPVGKLVAAGSQEAGIEEGLGISGVSPADK